MTYFWLVNYNSGNMINHAYFRLVNYYNLFRCIYESLKNCEINWCSNIARTCDSWFCVGLGSCFFQVFSSLQHKSTLLRDRKRSRNLAFYAAQQPRRTGCSQVYALGV